MNHRRAQKSLFAFALGECDTGTAGGIRNHLLTCSKCSKELERINVIIGHLNTPGDNPASMLEENYWKGFRTTVQRRITEESISERSSESVLEMPHRWRFRPRHALASAAAVAIVLFAIFFSPILQEESKESPEPNIVAQKDQEDFSSPRVGHYFRKSRALLVGLSNFQAPADSPIDFSFERKLSQSLASEIPVLTQERLDPRSRRLVTDMAVFLERVSNTDDQEPQIQMIRDDIRRQNLLFKIRMAESVHAGAQFVNVKDIP